MSAPSSPSYVQVSGDLLEFKCDLIVHQINCVSRRAKGLAHALFAKYPFADVYTKRASEHCAPGRAIMTPSSDKGQPFPWVVGITGQIQPGGPGPSQADSYNNRKAYFREGLKQLDSVVSLLTPKIQTIAFPFEIGCGLAQGHWSDYSLMIDDFAAEMKKKDVTVYVVQLETETK